MINLFPLDPTECGHPIEFIRAQRPGAGEKLQPEWCTQCGQELNDDGTPFVVPKSGLDLL